MPSVLIGNPLASGPQIVLSGNPWSGRGAGYPIGGIQLTLSPAASGNIYIGLSGNQTLNSGGMFLSGGGIADGMVLQPGAAYFIPRARCPVQSTVVSGVVVTVYNIYARHDAACSGQARLYYEIF